MNFKKFLTIKSGQAVVEYLLISAAMAAIFLLGFVDVDNFNDSTHPCSFFKKVYDSVVNDVYDQSYQDIQYGAYQTSF